MTASVGITREAPEAQTTTQAILKATLEVLGERGVRGATTRLIAQRADVNEVTLFRQFGTKSALIIAALVDRFSSFGAEAVAYTGDVEADLARLAERYWDALQEIGPVARVMLTEVAYNPELGGALEGSRALFSSVARLMGRYQAEGVIRDEPEEHLVPAFLGPLLLPQITPIGAVLGGPKFDAKSHVNRFLYGRAGA